MQEAGYNINSAAHIAGSCSQHIDTGLSPYHQKLKKSHLFQVADLYLRPLFHPEIFVFLLFFVRFARVRKVTITHAHSLVVNLLHSHILLWGLQKKLWRKFTATDSDIYRRLSEVVWQQLVCYQSQLTMWSRLSCIEMSELGCLSVLAERGTASDLFAGNSIVTVSRTLPDWLPHTAANHTPKA